MSYSVVKNDNSLYDIMEKNSGSVIEMCNPEEKEIRSICRKLNLGAGFNGWTPRFIAEKLLTNTID